MFQNLDHEFILTRDYDWWDSYWRSDHLIPHTRQKEGQKLIAFMTDFNWVHLLWGGTSKYHSQSS